MEKVTNQQFKEFIKYILYYLSEYIDITKIVQRYLNTKYVLTDNEYNQFKYSEEEYVEVIVKRNSGITVTPLSKDTGNIKIINPICIVRNDAEHQKKLREIMFHELMHVGSTKQELLDNEKLVFKTGLFIQNFKNGEAISDGKYNYLNEAMTELVAKFIYDKFNDKKYNIVSIIDGYYKTSGYEKGYFLLASLFLNYFEDNPKVLYDIYFNNNMKLLKKLFKELTPFNLEEINDLIKRSAENPYDAKLNNSINVLIDEIIDKRPIRNQDVLRQYRL